MLDALSKMQWNAVGWEGLVVLYILKDKMNARQMLMDGDSRLTAEGCDEDDQTTPSNSNRNTRRHCKS